jgi:hypothetical protein
MSPSDLKAHFDSQPIEVRAKMLLDGPGPMAPKIDQIKKMYEKEGKTPPADSDIPKLAGTKMPGNP